MIQPRSGGATVVQPAPQPSNTTIVQPPAQPNTTIVQPAPQSSGTVYQPAQPAPSNKTTVVRPDGTIERRD